MNFSENNTNPEPEPEVPQVETTDAPSEEGAKEDSKDTELEPILEKLEDSSASVKRESPDESFFLNCSLFLAVTPKSEPESMSTPVPGVSNVSTGNTEYEVSDDDYTNDYTEVNTKRRRRETRLCKRYLNFVILSYTTSGYMSYSEGTIFYRREGMYMGRKSRVALIVLCCSGEWELMVRLME